MTTPQPQAGLCLTACNFPPFRLSQIKTNNRRLLVTQDFTSKQVSVILSNSNFALEFLPTIGRPRIADCAHRPTLRTLLR
jgi:hypothetical protein